MIPIKTRCLSFFGFLGLFFDLMCAMTFYHWYFNNFAIFSSFFYNCICKMHFCPPVSSSNGWYTISSAIFSIWWNLSIVNCLISFCDPESLSYWLYHNIFSDETPAEPDWSHVPAHSAQRIKWDSGKRDGYISVLFSHREFKTIVRSICSAVSCRLPWHSYEIKMAESVVISMATTFQAARVVPKSAEELKKARETRAAEALRMKEEQLRILSDQNASLLSTLDKVTSLQNGS